MFNNCRIYVCKSAFGRNDKCISFADEEEYEEWWRKNKIEKTDDGYTFQPVCNSMSIFDAMILKFRNENLTRKTVIEQYKD